MFTTGKSLRDSSLVENVGHRIDLQSVFMLAIPQPTSTSNVPVTITVVPAEQQPQPTVYNSGTSKVSRSSVVSIVGAGLLLTLFLS